MEREERYSVAPLISESCIKMPSWQRHFPGNLKISTGNMTQCHKSRWAIDIRGGHVEGEGLTWSCRSSSNRELQQWKIWWSQALPSLPGEEHVPSSEGHSKNKLPSLWLTYYLLPALLTARWLGGSWVRHSKSCDIHNLLSPSLPPWR
jgi:hypothetical protein